MEVLTVLGCDCRSIDLGYDLNNSTIFWPGGEGFNLCMRTHYNEELDKFYAAGTFSCAEHGGTHVDAPWHFSKKGKTVDLLSSRQLIAPCRVIDVVSKCNNNSSFVLSCDDILEHESANGQLSPGSIVLIKFGWHSRYLEGPKSYLGFDQTIDGPYDPMSTVLSFPGISPEASHLFVERGISGVGLDTASLDPGNCSDFQSHYILLGNGIFGIENISGEIEKLPIRGSTLLVMPMKITGGSGAPARVLAFVPAETEP